MVRVVEVAPAKTCKCSNCKATLEYSFSDITERAYSCARDGGGTSYMINCPACSKTVYVSKWS
ncbi:hypothetical protein PMW_155 [Pseudomonas phage phiPMW]|uniref:Uncharacterized protein n=1 Tax=Pseudomonas phage phiPMW TaxID=1815582 RepID=A0A1S5R1J3_9CAUD|nr:hypothetical protein FDG97_gp195 [Pseudomonas phage phiPMW]ANA49280.1 hypothetical protein PMW_155 [Pseudomonas phage phiPMW]